MLSRLEGVKQTGPGRWLARCPAHQDCSPSLSIKQCDGGVILLHDFAGCGAADILAAVGLELRDLFPRDYGRHGSGPRPDWQRDRIQAALDHEDLILEIARADLAKGKTLSADDRSRALQARDRARVLRRKLHARH
ncbi:MAG: DNA primase [Rhodanobacteraceae bacterium]|nr:MAG: DNA primase [Rhodanobacteraceae bacterium]